MNRSADRVLCVDDEPNILEAIRRTMAGQFELTTALGGAEGLARIDSSGPFAVVVSDLRMPGVDGVSLLQHVAERSPETTRILLTGNGDLEHAIRAVNEGQIFRFLTKPCASSALRSAILAGIRQHQLQIAERELLAETLRGSIAALAEIVALVHPAVGAQTSRVRRTVNSLAHAMGVADAWQVEIVAMLANLGMVTLPATVVSKLHCGRELLTYEQNMYARVPEIAAGLIGNIPRLEGVQEALLAQELHWDGGNSASAVLRGERIPLAARLVRVAIDLDVLESRGLSRERALAALAVRTGWYDPRVLAALQSAESGVLEAEPEVTITIRQLRPGMILAADLVGHEGALMVARGMEVSPTLVSRIREYWDDEMQARTVRVRRTEPPARSRKAA